MEDDNNNPAAAAAPVQEAFVSFTPDDEIVFVESNVRFALDSFLTIWFAVFVARELRLFPLVLSRLASLFNL